MSHGISSPSQENRSSDQTLTALVPTKVDNKQEMALDTALKALQASRNENQFLHDENQFLNDELLRTSEQAEIDLKDLRNVYEKALEVQADKIYSLQKRIRSLHKWADSLQKRNESLRDQEQMRSLEDNRHLKGTDEILPGRLSSSVGNNLGLWDAANASSYDQHEDQESRIDASFHHNKDRAALLSPLGRVGTHVREV